VNGNWRPGEGRDECFHNQEKPTPAPPRRGFAKCTFGVYWQLKNPTLPPSTGLIVDNSIHLSPPLHSAFLALR